MSDEPSKSLRYECAWQTSEAQDAGARHRPDMVRVCTRINSLLQLGFGRRAIEVIAIQMCAASQRGSRCWRKTLARYGEAGPKRALCVEAGTKGQIISRTDSKRVFGRSTITSIRVIRPHARSQIVCVNRANNWPICPIGPGSGGCRPGFVRYS